MRQTVAPDRATLNYRHWPAAEPAAAAVYLHGIAGHSLWFSPAASRLAAAGISVYGPDRRGSGLNVALGSGHLAHHEVVLADTWHFVQLARASHPGRGIFLIAGCWGAKAGVVFAARQAGLLDGLVLVAPALRARITLPLRDLLGVVAQLVLNPRSRFKIPLRPEQYTENPLFREFVKADPRRLLQATARFYFETARLDRLAAAAADKIEVPVLLQLGGRDVIVDVEGTRQWFSRLASADKQLRLYPEFAHILEFEAQRETYLSDLTAWFQAQTTGAGRTPPGRHASGGSDVRDQGSEPGDPGPESGDQASEMLIGAGADS